jgi:ParB family chromosome partitioning protein
VIIWDASDDTARSGVIENIQREDLNAVEEAEAYQALIDTFGLSQEELAQRVGKERSTVANSLRLIKLPAEIKRDVAEDRLSMGHARALLALDSTEQMKKWRDEILKRQLTVRQCKKVTEAQDRQDPQPANLDRSLRASWNS